MQSSVPINPIKIVRIQSRIVVGGPAKHTILLSKELNNNIFKTVLVGGASKSIEKSLVEVAQEQGVDCHIIPEMAREIHFYDDFISLIKLYKLIKKEKPIIFHSHTAKAGGIGRIAAYLARVPLIFHTFHGHVFSGYFGKIKTRSFIIIEKLLALLTTRIIVISNEQKRDIVQKYKICRESKVSIIRLGFDWKENFLKKSPVSLRKKHQIPRQKFLVGIIGRLVPIKDHKLFMRIAEKLVSSDHNDYHFIVIGDGELKTELIELAEKKKLNKYFTFTGWIEVNKGVYEELNLLLLTSINEGTPVTVIEALAAGTPVIASEVGGVADIMKFYKTEYLVKHRNVENFVEMIKRLRRNMDKPSLRTQKQIMQIYSDERLVEEIKELYLDSLNNFDLFNSGPEK